MQAPRPVAVLATHTQFRRLDGEVRTQRQRTSGVAGKAAQDLWFRVEGAIERSGGIGTNFLMAWRDIKRLRRGVEALPMLDVRILVDVSDESDGLVAGSKCPV